MGELINLNSSAPLMDADIPAAIARDSEVTSAIAAHIASEHASLIPLGAPATISASSIEDALLESYKSGFFAESHYLSIAGNGVFSPTSSNGGFGYMRAEPGYPGILGLSTGSTNNGFAGSATGMGNNSSGINLADGTTKYLGIVKIPVLRDAINDYVVEVGFQSAGTSIGLDACCFVYDGSSPNWQFHTRNNSDLSILITAIPVIANTWYRMEIIVANQIATFSIDGATQVTSNKLPLASRMVGAGMDIKKISGTTGRDILIDYQQISQKRAENSTTIPISTRTLTDADIPANIARDAEVLAAVNAHVALADPHPFYLTQAEGDALYRAKLTALTDADIPVAIARDSEVTLAISQAIDDFLPIADEYLPASIARVTDVDNSMTAHYLDYANPHPMYRIANQPLSDADIPASIARDSEVASAITAHTAIENPHDQYPVFTRFQIITSTSGGQGGTNYIPHNLLNTGKIRAVTALVLPGPNLLVPPGGLAGLPGYTYTVWIDGSSVCLRVHPTDSAYILGKPAIIIIDALP